MLSTTKKCPSELSEMSAVNLDPVVIATNDEAREEQIRLGLETINRNNKALAILRVKLMNVAKVTDTSTDMDMFYHPSLNANELKLSRFNIKRVSNGIALKAPLPKSMMRSLIAEVLFKSRKITSSMRSFPATLAISFSPCA